MWGRKRGPVVPDDTGEAQVIREQAEAEKRELFEQRFEIASLSRKLARRREANHFGEELSISFRPRGGRHA